MATTNAPTHQARQAIPTTALATVPAPNSTAIVAYGMSRDQLDLLKRTLAKGLTDDEFALYMNTANRMGLDPFAKQIYAIKRRSKDGPDIMSIQIAIDGYRASSHRTGEYDGQEGPFWCGGDGVWKDVWLEREQPAAAKVVVYRKGCAHPFVGIATWNSYVQKTPLWEKGGDYMLAKCAEAVALRKAFPAELGGTNTPDEVDHDADLASAGIGKLPAVAVVSAPPTAAKAITATPASAPAAPAQPEPASMTEEEAEEIRKAIFDSPDSPSMKAIFQSRIAPRKMDPAMRDRLQTAFREHRDFLREAAKGDAPAEQTP